MSPKSSKSKPKVKPHSPRTERLGKIIRDVREKMPKPSTGRIPSQEELSDRAGFHRTYWSSVERGVRNIAIENLIVIAKTLGLKPSDLLRKAGL